MTLHCGTACALVALLTCAGNGSASAATAAHNFVLPNLTWKTPEAPEPPYFLLGVTMVDTITIRRIGDDVEFDTLMISKVGSTRVGAGGQSPTTYTMHSDVVRYRASCGWRSLRSLPVAKTTNPMLLAEGKAFQQEEALGAQSRFNRLIDRACAGQPLGAARGLPSAAAAEAAWADKFGTAPNVPLTFVGQEPPRPAAWMSEDGAHRFHAAAYDPKLGRILFLDHASLGRRGDTVTGVSLVFLSIDARQFARERSPVVALRKTRYDCKRKTLTVVGQATWDRYAILVDVSEEPFTERGAAESPVTAMEISAACSGTEPPHDQRMMASFDAAWSYAHLQIPWTTIVTAMKGVCAWARLAEDQRTRFMASWTPGVRYMRPTWTSDEAAAAANSCGAGDDRNHIVRAIGYFGRREAALAALKRAGFNEGGYMIAWMQVPLRTRLRIMRIQKGYTPDDQVWLDGVIGKLADDIHLSGATARAALRDYVESQSKLDDL